MLALRDPDPRGSLQKIVARRPVVRVLCFFLEFLCLSGSWVSKHVSAEHISTTSISSGQKRLHVGVGSVGQLLTRCNQITSPVSFHMKRCANPSLEAKISFSIAGPLQYITTTPPPQAF